MGQPLRQIPFDLGSRAALGREDFLIGASNAAAVNLIDRWPDWPTPLLVISGPAASGKSHLAAVWRERTGAHILRPDMLLSHSAEQIAETGKNIILDGLDPWLGDRAAETALFHLYNIFNAEKRSILATMRMTPSQADFAVADLASRMRASLAAPIQPPDDLLLASVLIKLFSDRQLTISNDVIQYVLPRMERSFAAARDIVAAADRLALAEKRPVTVALLRQVLADLQS
ncbi:MAG: DNA replication protein [Alphaproteobacteria bacterium]|nr:DNA replication protein [Alphaproteobacteria bacterium]